MNSGQFLRIAYALFLSAALAAGGAIPAALANGDEVHAKPAAKKMPSAKAGSHEGTHKGVKIYLAFPVMNAERGMQLFAEKGCVACHAINGVGGHHSVALDAHNMDPVTHPFDFVAKMWQMAPYMIKAQEEALGEQILFSGEEIANIIAFVHDDDQQHKFTEALITPRISKMINHTHGGDTPHQKEIGHTEGAKTGH